MKISCTTLTTSLAASLLFGSISVNGEYSGLDEVLAELNAGLETIKIDLHIDGDVKTQEDGTHMTYPGWKQVGMDIIGGEVNSEAGRGVSLSDDGQTVAVGAPFQNDYGVYNGRTRVFRWDDAWMQLGSNIDGDGHEDVKTSGEFISLSADGNTIAIDEKNITIYRYHEEGKDWKQLGQDIPINEDNVDKAGQVSLSNDGNTVAYLGKFEGANKIYTIPYARVYHYDNSTWKQIGSQINGNTGDSSANALSLSGDGKTLAIGSFNRIHMYYLDVDKWAQKGADIEVEKLTTSISLSDDGNIMAASAKEWVHTYMFKGNWTEIPLGVKKDFGLFGAVALSGDGKTMAVGAKMPDEDIMGSLMRGTEHVRVYVLPDDKWIQMGQTIDGANAGDDFGEGVALSHNGEYVAIAAPKFDEGIGASQYDDQGHVRIFKLCKDEASCKDEPKKPDTPVSTDGKNTTLTDDKDKASTSDKDQTSNTNTTNTTGSNNTTNSTGDSLAFSGRRVGLLTVLIGLVGFCFVN